ncbi:MAG: phosphoribosylformylglycinamidine synthase subunit PurS [Candidatus Kapabacteria bacterium]|jgi:phosphoribosylformylglycinamidine synthase PurS subunit|nr:phosphoribosylformylglycinamidine synthase subunit PurS [Candidatus Kapabacteria bacterium]
MKSFIAKVYITLRSGILDVQGKAIEHALHSLDFEMINNVRIGKYITLNIEAQNDGQAKVFVENACKELLSNPIIEDFNIEIIEND